MTWPCASFFRRLDLHPESVRFGAYKGPVHRPGYRHHYRGVGGGIDFVNCLEESDKQPTDKTGVGAPGVTPGPVRAVRVRLARTEDDDSRDQHDIQGQEKKMERCSRNSNPPIRIRPTESPQNTTTATIGLPPFEFFPARRTARPSTASAWRIRGVLMYSRFWWVSNIIIAATSTTVDASGETTISRAPANANSLPARHW